MDEPVCAGENRVPICIAPETREKLLALLSTKVFMGVGYTAFIEMAIGTLAYYFARLYGPTVSPIVWEYNNAYRDMECICGDPYYRHFDGNEMHSPPVGCKYWSACGCIGFWAKDWPARTPEQMPKAPEPNDYCGEQDGYGY